MFEELQKLRLKSQNAWIYIHGYNVSWHEAVGSAAALQEQLNHERPDCDARGTTVVLFLPFRRQRNAIFRLQVGPFRRKRIGQCVTVYFNIGDLHKAVRTLPKAIPTGWPRYVPHDHPLPKPKFTK